MAPSFQGLEKLKTFPPENTHRYAFFTPLLYCEGGFWGDRHVHTEQKKRDEVSLTKMLLIKEGGLVCGKQIKMSIRN